MTDLDLTLRLTLGIGLFALLAAALCIWLEHRRQPWCWQCGDNLARKDATCARCGNKTISKNR